MALPMLTVGGPSTGSTCIPIALLARMDEEQLVTRKPTNNQGLLLLLLYIYIEFIW